MTDLCVVYSVTMNVGDGQDAEVCIALVFRAVDAHVLLCVQVQHNAEDVRAEDAPCFGAQRGFGSTYNDTMCREQHWAVVDCLMSAWAHIVLPLSGA